MNYANRIKLKNYSARKYGPRGVQIILPAKYVKASGVKPKDKIECSMIEGRNDILILSFCKKGVKV